LVYIHFECLFYSGMLQYNTLVIWKIPWVTHIFQMFIYFIIQYQNKTKQKNPPQISLEKSFWLVFELQCLPDSECLCYLCTKVPVNHPLLFLHHKVSVLISILILICKYQCSEKSRYVHALVILLDSFDLISFPKFLLLLGNSQSLWYTLRSSLLIQKPLFNFLLFICAYNAWVTSPPCPHPLPYHPPCSLSIPPPYLAETILPLPLILLKREYKQ
jgi:hypothetical protein